MRIWGVGEIYLSSLDTGNSFKLSDGKFGRLIRLMEYINKLYNYTKVGCVNKKIGKADEWKVPS